MIRFALLPALRLVAFAVLVACASGAARAATEAEAFVTEARLTVDRLMADKDFFELPKFVKAAKGIFIVPQLVKAASSSAPRAAPGCSSRAAPTAPGRRRPSTPSAPPRSACRSVAR